MRLAWSPNFGRDLSIINAFKACHSWQTHNAHDSQGLCTKGKHLQDLSTPHTDRITSWHCSRISHLTILPNKYILSWLPCLNSHSLVPVVA